MSTTMTWTRTPSGYVAATEHPGAFPLPGGVCIAPASTHHWLRVSLGFRFSPKRHREVVLIPTAGEFRFALRPPVQYHLVLARQHGGWSFARVPIERCRPGHGCFTTLGASVDVLTGNPVDRDHPPTIQPLADVLIAAVRAAGTGSRQYLDAERAVPELYRRVMDTAQGRAAMVLTALSDPPLAQQIATLAASTQDTP